MNPLPAADFAALCGRGTSVAHDPVMQRALVYSLAFAALASLATACRHHPPEGPAEKAGRQVDNAGRDVKDATKDAAHDVKHDMQK